MLLLSSSTWGPYELLQECVSLSDTQTITDTVCLDWSAAVKYSLYMF